MTDKGELFNLEKVYDEEIHPLMDQIIAICRRERIPIVASFAWGNGEHGMDLSTTYIPFEGRTPAKYADIRNYLMGHKK